MTFFSCSKIALRADRKRLRCEKFDLLNQTKELYEIIAYHTGQPYEKIDKDSDRDFWMTSTEAKEYGLIDEVLVKSR